MAFLIDPFNQYGWIMKKQKDLAVLLVDDHKMLRAVFRKTINRQQDMAVIGEASNGEEAIIFVQSNFPDVIVMDVDMPVMGGIEATKIIISMKPYIKIIGLSQHESPIIKENMYKAGASAYITKDEAFDTLSAAIQKKKPRKSPHS